MNAKGTRRGKGLCGAGRTSARATSCFSCVYLSAAPRRSNVVAIAGGGMVSLALKADGSVVVWGSSTYGLNQLPAAAATKIIAIAAAGQHGEGRLVSFSCAASRTGGVDGAARIGWRADAAWEGMQLGLRRWRRTQA